MKSCSNWYTVDGASPTTEVCAYSLLVFSCINKFLREKEPEKLVLAFELHLRWSKVACLLFNPLLYF